MNAIERKAIIRKERKTIPKALKLDFRFNICIVEIIKKAKIGFIGTGILGLPMAKNLYESNYDVYAYARNHKNHAFIVKKNIKLINTNNTIRTFHSIYLFNI